MRTGPGIFMGSACHDEEDRPLCNLYSVTKGQQAICEFTGAMRDLGLAWKISGGQIYPKFHISIGF
jgi:hypothetical protein